MRGWGLVWAVLVLGCDGRAPLDAEPLARCDPGTLQACRCDDGRESVSQCRPDGYRGACRCGSATDAGLARDGAAPDRFVAPPPLRDRGPPPVRDAALDGPAVPPDARLPDAAPDAAQPGCGAPVSTRIDGFEIFTYEASHPSATAALAYPGARQTGVDGPPAPVDDACSRPGVRPWHTVSLADARAACLRIGWRLCSPAELRRACGGPDGLPWTWGLEFEGGRCNLREAYTARGAEFASVAPAGHFAGCRSPEGVMDGTGNLWEWTADGIAQAAGWRLIAERHRDDDQRCDSQLLNLPPGHRSPSLGFRCCR